MATNIPDGYASVSIEYTSELGTGPFYNTFGITLPDGIALLDVANFCLTTWQDVWLDKTFSTYVINRAIVTLEAPGGGLGSVVSDEPAEPGTGSGDGAVVASAVVLTKLSGLIGRQGRGRFFIPGVLGDSDVPDTGVLSPSLVSFYTSAGEEWLAAMQAGAAGWTTTTNPQILHSDDSLPPSAISGLRCAQKVGWLRKRLR